MRELDHADHYLHGTKEGNPDPRRLIASARRAINEGTSTWRKSKSIFTLMMDGGTHRTTIWREGEAGTGYEHHLAYAVDGRGGMNVSLYCGAGPAITQIAPDRHDPRSAALQTLDLLETHITAAPVFSSDQKLFREHAMRAANAMTAIAGEEEIHMLLPAPWDRAQMRIGEDENSADLSDHAILDLLEVPTSLEVKLWTSTGPGLRGEHLNILITRNLQHPADPDPMERLRLVSSLIGSTG